MLTKLNKLTYDTKYFAGIETKLKNSLKSKIYNFFEIFSKGIFLRKTNQIVFYILVLCVISFIQYNSSYSQVSIGEKNANGRKIVFDNIRINSEKINKSNWNDLLISSNDTIQFSYHLDNNSNAKEPFMFYFKFTKDSNSFSDNDNQTQRLYKNLKEGEYSFSINAAQQFRRWISPSTTIKFKVNNQEAEKRKAARVAQFKKAKEEFEKAKKDSIEKAKSETSNLLLIIGFGLIVLIGGSFLIYYFYKRKSNSNQKTIAEDESDSLIKTLFGARSVSTITISKTEHQNLLDENTNLKNELAALRGQIALMDSRSAELKVRNRELEDSVAKLSSSKEELENLQTQKDELFAIIIHDIKNPAALIKSLVELLRSYDLTATEQQDVMNDILATTSRIVSLSHEVSRVLALEGGKMRLEIDRYDISEIIEDVFHRNNVRAKEKGIRFETDIKTFLPEAEFDAQKITEVIENLVSNAIKFTKTKGSVLIKASQNDNTVVVEVSDTGPGMSEQDLKEAFKRGSQLSAKPTDGESSTGLGLWIVKKLVEAHNGRVWVRSTIGKGATFAFSLPINSTAKSFTE